MASPAYPTTSASAPAVQGERAGRLSDFQGSVWLFDTEQGQWSEALRNRALTEGDRVSTDRSGLAELRVGSTELRLGAGSELEIVRLDDSRMSFQLHRGSLALRVRSREIAAEVEVLTAEARLLPERAGAYRVDRQDDSTWATVWRGGLQVQAPDQAFSLAPGQRVELAQDGRGRDRGTLVTWSSAEQDRFAEWVSADEQRDDRSASLRYVSPEMTGVEDLDRHGRWERHPEYGMVWSPLVVAVGWAPFKHGRWIWHARWGWTWVDQAPWGFAPFHYGRWVMWGSRWVWTPGARVARPAFAPALVTFSSPGVGVSVVIGPSRPPAHWVPLAPREPHPAWHAHRPHRPVAPVTSVHPHLPVHPVHPVIPVTRPHRGELPSRPHQEAAVDKPERRLVPRPAPGVAARPAPEPPVYTGGRSRETEDVLVPAPQARVPETPRPPRGLDPDVRRAQPVVQARPAPAAVTAPPSPAAPRPEFTGRVQRPDRADPADKDKSERGARGAQTEDPEAGGRPGRGEGRGRSTTEHRPRDQRERAQML